MPSLRAFVGLAAAELVVTHLLLAHCAVRAAVVLSTLSLTFMAWLVASIAP